MDPQAHPQQNALPLADELVDGEGIAAADPWVAGLDELRRDYEAGMAYADRFARDLSSAIYAESVRVYATSPEEIQAVERMTEEERVAWMCDVDVDALGVPSDNYLGLAPTGEQPPLDLFPT